MNFIGQNYNAFASVAPDDFRTLGTLQHKNAGGLFIGVGGDLVIAGIDGIPVTFKNVPSGTVLPVYATKVLLTGTTATFIVALYQKARTPA